MKKLFMLYGVECFISFCLISFGLFRNNELYAIIAVYVFTTEFLLNMLMSDTSKRRVFLLFSIFTTAFLLRLYLIYYDVYIQEIDPGDCRDFRVAAENFFYTNRFIFRNREGFSGTILVMGTICKIFGPQRIIIQYWNALCFMMAAYITYHLLCKLSVDFRIRFLVLTWMLFTPQNIKNTSISNREGYISFFLALSILLFVKYIEASRIFDLLQSITCLLLSVLMHAGTIGLLAGYVFYLSLFDKNTNQYKISIKSVFIFSAFSIAFYYIYTNWGDVIFSKIGGIDSVEDITNHHRSVGGAAYYVPGEGTATFFGMLLYSPIRAVFFLLSPQPWSWRGFRDMIAFIVCSVPQIMIMYLTIKKVKFMSPKHKVIFITLLVSAIAVAIIFGWTAGNAGTDIRHRDKFLSLYVCMLGMLLNIKKGDSCEQDSPNPAILR